ncbi:hypothetical protein JWS46_004018 [Salmonella enterica]|nr:hypothetical protein [Salmonella enterica]
MRTYILELAISVEELVEKLGGTGRGLHEKTKSIAYLLEPKYERKLHMIASVRNKASHRRILPDRIDVYEQAVEETRLYLEELVREEERKRRCEEEINPSCLEREAMWRERADEAKRRNEEKRWDDMSVIEKIGWGAGIAIVGAAVAYLKIKSRD